MHHIAADHWSAGVLFSDVLSAYRARGNGQPPVWAPLPVQYADYAAWQAALLTDETGLIAAQRDYWKQQLDGLPPDTGLRPDFARPPVPSGAGDSVDFTVDAATRAKLVELSRELGITEFMLLQSAVAVVLHKAGEKEDIPLGTPVAGRTESELDQLIGFFINILVLRNDLRGNPTVRQVLLRAREAALAAYAHQDLPFDRVVDAVSPVRSLSRNPLFGVVVHVREELPAGHVIDSGPDGDTTFTALEPTFDVAHADLSVNFFATADGYRGNVIYRPELYKRVTVERLAGWLGRVLDAFADDPDQTLRDVEIDDADERRFVDEWSGGHVYLLDDAMKPVPVGVVGDLYHAGAPLGQGNWDSPVVTAARFVPNPYAAKAGSRFYRGGERARWTQDGRLEFVGRTDHEREVQQPPTTAPSEPARTDTERALAAMLADVLDAPEVSRYDDFFALGGDSILAVQLAARARDAGLALTARMVFEHPALHELAAALDDAGESDEPGDTHHAPMTASGLSAAELAALTSSWTASGDGAQ